MTMTPDGAVGALTTSETQVLTAPEDGWPGLLDEFRPHIAACEFERARRFVHRGDRLRFLVTRGLLRLVLGRVLGCRPSALVFTANASGKPQCNTARRAGVAFNASHCHGLVAVGVARRPRLGVDVERSVDASVVALLAPRVCTSSEQRFLNEVEPARQGLAFSLLWTRKEAVLKGIGCGLRRDPKSLDVAAGIGEQLESDGAWSVPADIEEFRVWSRIVGHTHVLSAALYHR
jgi:4'-phosphopantetheinyl transferase